MRRALRARPVGSVIFPFVCDVNVGDLLCGTSIASIESIKFIESIESVEPSDSIQSTESIQSIELIAFIVLVRADFKNTFFRFRKFHFDACLTFSGLRLIECIDFRPISIVEHHGGINVDSHMVRWSSTIDMMLGKCSNVSVTSFQSCFRRT